jgi:hypothetical protein
MNPIDNIMALADRYADAGIYEPAARLRQALRAALEQALGQGEPDRGYREGYERGIAEGRYYKEQYMRLLEIVAKGESLRTPTTLVITTPQPQREWVGLSGEEVTQQCRTVGVGSYQTLAAAFKAGVEFANAKLREKNGGGV